MVLSAFFFNSVIYSSEAAVAIQKLRAEIHGVRILTTHFERFLQHILS